MERLRLRNGLGSRWKPIAAFGAPAEIHSAVVELLPPAVRDRIVEHVKSDLLKVEPAKLVSHFRSLQQI
jgi:hypothetical protein